MFNNQLHHFYNTLFTEKLQMQNENITAYLSLISIPVLAGEQSQKCEGPILESELLKALKNMSNNKSPRNDGLTKEFYERFWEDLKKPLCASITKALQRGELSHSQKEAVIKLIEKKDRDKKLIKNWRPISLLNINTKLISEVLAERLKNVLPFLISSDQTGYVKGRFISEGGRLISDVLEICDKLQIKSFLMTVDIEKAFDSINHCLLIKVLDKYGFEKDFIKSKPNKSKCEIAGTWALKGVQVAGGMRCIDLASNIDKILGIYYSCNDKLEIQKNLKGIL